VVNSRQVLVLGTAADGGTRLEQRDLHDTW
jgi:hypothetical protein